MLVLNAGLQNKHISQFTWSIDVFNYWNWEGKERAMLTEEIIVELIQFKLEHHSAFGS
jgi:hypothetical protein